MSVPSNISTAVSALNDFITVYNALDFDEAITPGVEERNTFDALIDSARVLVRQLSDAESGGSLGTVSLKAVRGARFGNVLGDLCDLMHRKGIDVA